jgi:hypothetical protein
VYRITVQNIIWLFMYAQVIRGLLLYIALDRVLQERAGPLLAGHQLAHYKVVHPG